MSIKINRINEIKTNTDGRRFVQDLDSGVQFISSDAKSDQTLKHFINNRGVNVDSFAVRMPTGQYNYKIAGIDMKSFEKKIGILFTVSGNLSGASQFTFKIGKTAVTFDVSGSIDYIVQAEVDGEARSRAFGSVKKILPEDIFVFGLYIDFERDFISTTGNLNTSGSDDRKNFTLQNQGNNEIDIKFNINGPKELVLENILLTSNIDEIMAVKKDDSVEDAKKIMSYLKKEYDSVAISVLSFAKALRLIPEDHPTLTHPQIEEKILGLDLVTSSGVAALNVRDIATNNDLKNLRAIQRILSLGQVIGENRPTDVISLRPLEIKKDIYGVGLSLSIPEAIRILSIGYYSSAQLAKSTQKELIDYVFLHSVSYSNKTTSLAELIAKEKKRASLLLEAARHRASLVSLAYINTKNLSSPALIAAQRRDEDPELTFENLYNSGEYFNVKPERSVYSLPAYTVALKELVDTHIEIDDALANKEKSRLEQRRPDLNDIVISAENSSKLQPKLNIVNGLLRHHASDNKAKQISDEALDSVVYPFNFPFNGNHSKIDVALANANLSWSTLRHDFDVSPFSEYTLGISPSMLEEIARDNPYSDHDVSPPIDTDKLKIRWGQETGDSKYQELEKVTQFTAVTGVDESLLHYLLFADLSVDEISAGKARDLYINAPTRRDGEPLNPLAFSTDATNIKNLDDTRKDRIRRLLMLSKEENISIMSLYRLLRATGNRINREFLQCLAAYRFLAKTYKLSEDEFISLIANLRSVGRGNSALAKPTFVQQIFQRDGQPLELLEPDGKSKNRIFDPSATTNEQALARSVLANQLNISDLDVKIAARIIQPTGALTLTLENLSALYRITLLSRLLAIDIAGINALFFLNNSKKLLSENTPLSDKLTAIYELVNSKKTFANLKKSKTLSLSPAELYDLTNSRSRLTISADKSQQVVKLLKEALERSNKLTFVGFNKELSDIGCDPIDKDAFAAFVTDGLIRTVKPMFIARIKADKQAVAQKLIDTLLIEQQADFDIALAEAFELKPAQSRFFSAWLSSIVLMDANAENMSERLDKSYNLDLRNKLTDKTPDAEKRLILQQAKQLATIIRLFSLTPDNWQQLLKQPTLLSDFALGQLPTFQALISLAVYEMATATINNQTTPLFALAQQQTEDTTKVAGEMVDWFKGSEVNDFTSLMAILAATKPKRPLHKTVDGLGRVILAFRQSKKIRLKPVIIKSLLAVGGKGYQSYRELSDLSKQVTSELQTSKALADQARARELENLRDRLLSLALFRMRKLDLPVTNNTRLQQYLLTDVFVGGQTLSTPVKEASLSLQQFANQALNGLVAGHKPNDTFKEFWEWMFSYTSWEANRRTFLETENYLLPELRRNKSEPYVALESRLNAIVENPKIAEVEFRKYAEEVFSRNSLQTIIVADGQPEEKSILLVAKRRSGKINELFYRQATTGALYQGPVGGTWKKMTGINLSDNESRSVSACYAFGKWQLFWLNYRTESPVQANIPAYGVATVFNSSLNKDDLWTAPKEVETAVVPAGLNFETKDNFWFIRAYNENAFKISGKQDENRKIWDRFDAIKKALKEQGSGKNLTKVLYENIKPHGDITPNQSEFDKKIIEIGNGIKEEGKDKADFFMPDFLQSSQNSELNLLQQQVTNRSEYTDANGVVLILPPVFGVFHGEIINPVELSADAAARKSINQLAKVQLLNNGIDWSATAPSYESEYTSNHALSKLLLNSDGDVRVISANKLSLVHDKSITDQVVLHGGRSKSIPFKAPNINYLTSGGNVGNIVLLKYDQPLKTIGGNVFHEYLFDIRNNQAFRIRSEASRTILKNMGKISLNDFMNPAIQTLYEARFDALQPDFDKIGYHPSDTMSFDGFNGASYWEVFFHAPMAIAQALKEEGKYKAAENWYHYVFDTQRYDFKLNVENFHLGMKAVKSHTDSNSFWRSVAMRKNSPSELSIEIYLNPPSNPLNDDSRVAYFIKFKEAEIKPDILIRCKKFEFTGKRFNGDSIGDFFGEENIVFGKRHKDILFTKEECLIKMKGSIFLEAGVYYLQGMGVDSLHVFVDGTEVIDFRDMEIKDASSEKRYVLCLHNKLNVARTGIHQIELYSRPKGKSFGFYRLGITPAKPGVGTRADTYNTPSSEGLYNPTYIVESMLRKITKEFADENYHFDPITSQKKHEQKLLEEIGRLSSDLALTTYINDPYNPHALAAVNMNAYRVWTFYEYLDNIIKQGDTEFRRFTRESLPNATLHYIRAEDFLGDRPVDRGFLENLPSDAKLKDITNGSLLDFDGDGDVDLDDADIQGKRLVDASSGVLQQALELMLESRLARQIKPVSSSGSGNPYKKNIPPQSFLDNSYFAIPQNKRTLGLWKTVANRLFNIRNGRNINGDRVILPITQPTVSPERFARAEGAGQADAKRFLTSASAPIPHYRFGYAIDRAEALTDMLMNYGSKLLTLYQSKDTAELEELRAGYEQSILEAGKQVLQEQLRSAETAIEIILNGYGKARYLEYKNALRQNIATGQYLTGDTITEVNYQVIELAGTNKKGQQDKYAQIGTDFSNKRKKQIESFRNAVGERTARNKHEVNSANVNHAAFAGNAALDAVEAVGQFLDVAPNIFGLAVGGSKWSASVDGSVAIGRLAMDILSYVADTEATKADLVRRTSGWEEDRQLAIHDQDEFENRLIQANHDRLAIKEQISNLDQQIQLNKHMTNLVKNGRTTNSTLFDVLLKGMISLYKELYKIAMSAAREAERAWVFEKARTQSFALKDVWEEGRKGLLAGESLMLMLQQMRQSYLQEDKRRFEILKIISLKNNKDVQVEGSSEDLITTLKAKNKSERSVTFSLPARIFDKDYPGHILRQIKSISITIPAVIGPYENVGATLKQLNNNVLLYNDSAAAVEMTKGHASSFASQAIRKDFRKNEAIAVSTGVDDTGMFQLNFDDPRFLPFEGTGVDSKWRLEFSEFMPKQVFDSISDIIMEVRYTAEPGDDLVKSAVTEAIRGSAV